jgi:hypothetical protein
MGLVLAWLIGESIVGYRWAKNGAPPPPGAVAAASIIFIGCAALGTWAPARTTATVFAFGVDLAVLLKVLPGGNDTQVTNWPPEYIPCGHLLPVNGGGVSAKPDCSGSGVLSPTSGGANAGNAPGAGAAEPGTPPLGAGATAGEGPAKPKNGKCPSGYVYQNGKCLPLVSGQVAG